MTSFCIAVLGLLVLGLCVKQPDFRRQLRHTDSADENLSPKPRVSLALTVQAFKFKPFLLLLTVSSILAMFTLSDNMLYLGLHKRNSLGMQYIPLCFAATGLTFMLLAVPIGKLADRIGGLRVFLAGYLSLGILYALFTLLPNTGSIDVVICIFLLGLYYACTDGVLMSMAAQQLPTHVRTTGLALLATMISLGRLVSSVMYGWLWENTSHTVAIAWFGGLMLLALCAVFWVIKTLKITTYENA
jgi:MFS family permease